MMTAQDKVSDKPHSVVERLTHTFSDWLKHRQQRSELRGLNTAEFDRVARDLRVSPADLDELVRQGPHAADELPKRVKALGIDEDDLKRIEPMVLHDMERVCVSCKYKHQCGRDLAAGTSPEHYREYCQNASTIGGLGRATGK